MIAFIPLIRGVPVTLTPAQKAQLELVDASLEGSKREKESIGWTGTDKASRNACVVGQERLMTKLAIMVFIILLALSALADFPVLVRGQGGQWTKYSNNPILSPTPGTWDADYMILPTVLFVPSNGYMMWYVGSSQKTTGIGFASSRDGYTWTKHTDPVLTPGPTGSWDGASVSLGGVIWNGTLLTMWYVGGGLTLPFLNGAVGLATSTDGIKWTKYSRNPVLRPGNLDSREMSTPFVVKVPTGLYNMWYAARGQGDPPSSSVLRILYTQSFDGTSWTTPTVVLQPNATAWDSGSVFSPSVFFDGFMFGMWYSALGQGSLVPEIGYATSKDGRTWEKSSASPILEPGASGSWDSGGVENPRMIFSTNGFMLYYDGIEQNSGNSIGLAWPPRSFQIPEFTPTAIAFIVGVALLTTALVARRNRKPSKRNSSAQSILSS